MLTRYDENACRMLAMCFHVTPKRKRIFLENCPLKGQSHEIDQAVFDMMHSSKPGKETQLVLNFYEDPLNLYKK